MKKKVFLIGFVLLFGCSKKKLDYSEQAIDSIPIYLVLANEDSISYKDRLSYNKKAFDVFIRQENDSMNRVNLFKVANRYFNMSNFKKYQNTVRIIVEKAKEGNDTVSLAKGYCYLGDYYMNTSIKDSAYFYYTKAEKIYQKKNDKINLAGVYISTAIVQGYEKDFLGGERSAIKALNVLRGTNGKAKIYEAYNTLGVTSSEMKDYEKAIEYYNKALSLAKENSLSNFHEEASALNNIGNAYQHLNKDKLAIEKFREALKDKEIPTDNPNLYAVLLNNLAYSKFKLKDFSNLPDLFYDSLKIRDSLDLNLGIVYNKIHLSEYYAMVKDTATSRQFAIEALELSRDIKSYRDVLASLNQLSNVEPQKASIYSAEYIKINDSLQSAERRARDKFARIRYETDEVILEKDKAILQKWTVFWIAVSILLTGLIFYAFKIRQSRHRELLLLQSQQKANEEIYRLIVDQQQKFDEGREKEKKRIARELHDGTINRLSGIRASLSQLEKKTDPETIRHCIEQVAQIQEVEKEVRDIAHDLNRNAFSPKRGYPELLESAVAELAGTASLRIDLDIDSTIDWEALDGQKKKNIYHILQECLHYIKEHVKATEIKIRFLKNNSLLEIEISNDDNGFDTQDCSPDIRNIMSRAKEIDASLKISTGIGQGTSIKLTIPLWKTQIKTVKL